MRTVTLAIFSVLAIPALATDYNVGPGQPLSMIAEVPWESLQAGDRVYIHWQDTPYYEKWVVNAQGTELAPIEIIGVPGPSGELPVISGDGATTPPALNFWNEVRGVIKVGGSNTPADGLPSWIVIENLEVRSGHPDYQFTNDNGVVESYVDNAAAIYVEKAEHLTIRNCELHDCGNGIFIGAFDGQTQDIMIDGNYIHGNGIEGEFLEHNTYTSAIGITYQFNRFGPLRPGADGNNLKDRSAGLVVRYNWIEAGNRQLDLVDASAIPEVNGHPSYSTTHVYGNILIEPDDGNSQIMHYGGDGNNEDDYRKGILYFYNNTVISTRSGNTTLVRLSSNDESALAFNNVIHATAGGQHMAMIAGSGTFDMDHNWVNTDWQDCHCLPEGTVNDTGTNLSGDAPGFVDFDLQNFRPTENSPLVDSGAELFPEIAADYPVDLEYLEHTSNQDRWNDGALDIGAFEYESKITSVFDSDELIIAAFPNPARDELNVQIDTPDVAGFQFEIRSITGQLLFSDSSVGGQPIDVGSLAPGMYQLVVMSSHTALGMNFVKL